MILKKEINGFFYELRINEFVEDGIYVLNTETKTFDKLDEVSNELSLIFETLKKEYINTKYQRDRKAEYDKLNQDELRYNDLINGTNTWIEAIQEIKVKYPKPE